MKKRLLNATASDILSMSKEDKLDAIRANEGRTIMSENVCTVTQRVDDVTNTELAASLSSDMIMLNTLDLYDPVIVNLGETDEPIKKLKDLTGKIVGVNLEPIDSDAPVSYEMDKISEGRIATKETFEKANEMGIDFISLTGNPGTGVSNKAIVDSVKVASEVFDGIIVAGKMHGAGVSEDVLDLKAIEAFIDNGAEIVLIPAAGTVPGVSQEDVSEACKLIKKKGALSLAANGTSQDSSHVDTIRQIGIMNKMAGADIQHIGDAGPGGIAPWENILALSVALRGDRHTLRLMGQSVKR